MREFILLLIVLVLFLYVSELDFREAIKDEQWNGETKR